jgi:hypothetical protein
VRFTQIGGRSHGPLSECGRSGSAQGLFLVGGWFFSEIKD